MPKQSAKGLDFAKHWGKRIQKANEYYNKWEDRFQCVKLNEYIEGKQLPTEYKGYVINLIYSSLKVKKPSLIFSRPEFELTPKPWKSDWNPELAYQTALYKQDTLNSVVQDNSMEFAKEVDMVILDSWSRFGVLEYGYSANWIINPNAGKPVLKSDYYDLKSGEKEGKEIQEPRLIPEKENVFVKRINAERFRVGGSDTHSTKKCSWVGYYDWVRLEDLHNNKEFLDKLDTDNLSVGRSDDYYFDESRKERDIESQGDMVKIWKIWDLRKMEFLIFLTAPEQVIYTEPFNDLPICDLRFDKRTKGWYPVPAIYNWKSPQDEYNEARNQMRSHRVGARKMFQAVADSIDDDEKEKFITGPDFTVITTKMKDAITPIQNGSTDASIIQSLQLAPDEFDKTAGVSNNQRGVSDRGTAQEATIVENRTRVREDYDQSQVAEFLCDIGRGILKTVISRFSEDFFIKRMADAGEIGDEFEVLKINYELINAQMLDDGADFDVTCTVTSLSPVTQEIELQKFLRFMSIITQYGVIALHPNVIRKIAYLCGFRDEVVIRSMMQSAQLAMMAQIEQGTANMGNMAQNQVAQDTPPTTEMVRQDFA